MLTRRRFLQGTAAVTAAAALGWRPTAAPTPVVAAPAVTVLRPGVRKLATSVPVTSEALEDVPAFEALVRERLAEAVRRREDRRLR